MNLGISTSSELSQAKFYEGYARYREEDGRYETWEEAVDRVMDMHVQYYKDKLNPELLSYIEIARKAYKEQRILGAQRALQFGGEQLLKHQMRLYNCFSADTSFLTRQGIKSFSEFKDGDICEVLTHKGNWKKAKVKSYGEQELFEITFRRKSSKRKVFATKNHRWLLSDGSETTELKIGDKLMALNDTKFEEFSWETATVKQKLYWCYGYVYGDGTVTYTKGKPYSLVRLCGSETRYLSRFEEMGFDSSTNDSINGDIFVYTGKYTKDLPDISESIEDLLAFVRGFLDADGEKSCSYWEETGSSFTSIYQTLNGPRGEQTREFIKRVFPLVGAWVINEKYCDYETNFGFHNGYRYSLTTTYGSKYSANWTVESIEPINKKEIVWCLEVEDDSSFVLDGGIITGNCTSSYADRPEFFGEAFYILLCGSGAGFSVQKQHVAKLPAIQNRTKQPKTHIVEDSIEGWSTALDVLLSSYFVGGGKHPEYEGRKVYFDLSQVRPRGARISGGFKAPGPEPLRLALDRIEHLLQGLVLKGKTQLRPIHVYDIVMHSSDAVLAGGVRRSATICLFSKDDQEMASAKTGNWFNENPQRARSNNSAVILRSELKKEEFKEIMNSIKEFGEPGFFFVDDLDVTTNPCVEIGMYPQLDGISGWQGCNLTEINGSMCKTEEDFDIACTAAAVLGTLQAGYTDFKFVGETTKKIFEREALLGVSITGWMNNPDILFDRGILEQGAKTVKNVNKKIAALIGINPAARTTCAKPSGNASILLQTASGIHPEHSKRYLRNVQLNNDTEVAQLISKQNPYMVEDSIWSANKTDIVASFPVIPTEGSLTKNEIYGVKHLEYVKLAQKHWVESGTNLDLCVNKTVRHNISNTIAVKDWDETANYIYKNRNFFAGIALISDSGDKIYYQAPFTEVLTVEEIVSKYGTGSVFASGLIVDCLNVFDNLWKACNHVKYTDFNFKDSDDHVAMKHDWVRRYIKFANNYFDGDIQKAEHCLKDVFLLHKWEKIQKNFKPIVWTNELKEKKFTDIDTTGAAACVGVKSDNGTVGCLI